MIRVPLHYVTQPYDIRRMAVSSHLMMGWNPSRQNQEGELGGDFVLRGSNPFLVTQPN